MKKWFYCKFCGQHGWFWKNGTVWYCDSCGRAKS